MLENAGLSEYEAAELEKIFYRLDRASLRELAEVWRADVPMEQNTDYIQMSQDLNKVLENALMERFAHGPSAAPIDPDDQDDDPDPEHGLKMPPRPGGRKVRPETRDLHED